MRQLRPVQDKTSLSKENSWALFNKIAPRYDLLNRILSFGLDIRWRKKMIRFLPKGMDLKILDLATGTADVLLSMFEAKASINSAYGLDLAEEMLIIGRKKIADRNLSAKITLKNGDAAEIPSCENTFDCATIAFGIRNMPDPKQVLREIYRVLKINGRTLILEFSLPPNRFIRALHLVYLRHLVPLIGGLFTGHYAAYRYLNQTIEQFPYGKDFCQLLTDAGFKNTQANPLLFGTATIYQGDKF